MRRPASGDASVSPMRMRPASGSGSVSPLRMRPGSGRPRAAWATTELPPKRPQSSTSKRLKPHSDESSGAESAVAPKTPLLLPPYFEASGKKVPSEIGQSESHGAWASKVLSTLQPKAPPIKDLDRLRLRGTPTPTTALQRNDSGVTPEAPAKRGDRPGVEAAGKRVVIVVKKERDPVKIPGAPSEAEILRRLQHRSDGLSSEEQVRILRAGRRFKLSEVPEVKPESLPDILSHLGYFVAREESVEAALQVAFPDATPSSLSFSELMQFVEVYGERERDEMKGVLDACECGLKDTGLSKAKLMRVLRQLGAYPPDSAIVVAAEAAELGDVFGEGAADGAGGTFEDLLAFLAAYRAAEGLSHEEFESLRRVWEAEVKAAQIAGRIRPRASGFDEGSGDTPSSWSVELPFFQLEDILMEACGKHAKDDIAELLQKVPSLQSKLDRAIHNESSTPVQGTTLHEVCVCFRRLRDVRRARLWEDFDFSGPGDDGHSPFEEIVELVRGLGYTLSVAAIMEFLGELGEAPAGRLEFDTYVRMLDLIQEHEGFVSEEREVYQAMFSKFDAAGTGELSLAMILDMFRYIYGYTLREDEIAKMMREVDTDQSGTMCFSEFLTMMRSYRENELKRARAVFCVHARCRRGGGIAFSSLRAALEGLLAQAPRAEIIQRLQGCRLDTDLITFDEFVGLADQCRSAMVAELRKQASFTQDELECIRSRFHQAGAVGGSLTRGQYLWLLLSFGVRMTTMDERVRAIGQLEEARAAALEAGVDASQLGDGESNITLFCVIHHLRLILREHEAERDAKEELAAAEARFDTAERQEFRQIFLQWVQEYRADLAAAATEATDREAAQGTSPTAAARHRRSSLPAVGEANADSSSAAADCADTEGASAEPPGDGPHKAAHRLEAAFRGQAYEVLPLRPLFKSLHKTGLRPRHAQQHMELLIAVRDLIGEDGTHVDFSDFLRLMRWMIDANFGGVGTFAPARPPSAVPGSPAPRETGAGRPRLEAVSASPTPMAGGSTLLAVSSPVGSSATPGSRSRRRSVA